MNFLLARAPRCFIANISTGESIECMFNPEKLKVKISANYNRISVPGLSHQPLQYQSTGNRQLPGVEFYLDKFFAAKQSDDDDILHFRDFFVSLTKPTQIYHAPPRTLFLWSGVITIETVITDLEFQYRKISQDGKPLIYTVTCTFEEILDVREPVIKEVI